jgi:type I restriction enzyme R subunit
MDKKSLTEAEICDNFITPAVKGAGWEQNATTRIRREYSFTKGRILVRGKIVSRGKPKRADYVLFYQHIPIALIEAKDNTHNAGDGMQQGLEYAVALDIPYVFTSNGDNFVFHDRTGASAQMETHLALETFPSPEDLWARYCGWKQLDAPQARVVLEPYLEDDIRKEPRYYQRNAINATVEAIAKNRNRILLVMATGTGKTLTAFQIIWRLWKAGAKKRVLFLADRNVLIDQTMVNDFRPFIGKMAKLSTASKTIERADGNTETLVTAISPQRTIDKSYEIYLGLYQAIIGPEESQKIFCSFSPDLFDLIVVDECHRGSAAEDSAWREILEYFSSATQIGMTATPKETEYVSNINYFGPPVYTYSLKQGIEDGFLAPYKVIKVHFDVDIEGYRPEPHERDQRGNEIEDREYNQRDFDRKLVIDERTRRVAKWVSDYLKESGDRFQKTIVFCVDTEHAARMRQALVNENADLCQQNDRYVMRMTGDDPIGSEQVSNFIDPESKYPVIVTTSRLLSTGVDAQTCRLIVLDRTVGSMTEFKQIIGRGTRVHEDTKKYYFTLIDFRKATNHFSDPDFDGEPVQIYEPKEDEPHLPPDEPPPANGTPNAGAPQPEEGEVIVAGPVVDLPPQPPTKYYIKGQPVVVLKERIEYLNAEGNLVTEDLRDYSRKAIRRRYTSLEQFLRRWKSEEAKAAIIKELEAEGLPPLEALSDEVGRELDPFDLICFVAFDAPPLTRRERAARVRKQDIFTKYGPQARKVLDALLEKYQDEPVMVGMDDLNLLRVAPFSQIGTVPQLIKAFGDADRYKAAVHELQSALYAS